MKTPAVTTLAASGGQRSGTPKRNLKSRRKNNKFAEIKSQ
jgi:hypothetical protein